MERPLALVVDKDPAIRDAIRDTFERHDVKVLGAGSENETHELLRSRRIGFLILDLDSAGVDTLGLARRTLEFAQAPIVIGLSERASGPADELLALGGFDVLFKPFDPQDLSLLVRRSLREQSLRDDLRRLEQELQARESYAGFVGRSEAMERLRERLRRLSTSATPVWFTGEHGTGKELAARTLHSEAGGRPGSFVVVSCANLDARGWEAGWFASGDVFERARGAVYLDGLPQLGLALQERLGEVMSRSRAGTVPVRWFSSSTEPPEQEVEQGRLLDDLRQELATDVVALAPLRQRVEDVSLLAQHFLTQIREINRLPPMRLAPEALTLLERHRWPGNVQELRNALEQAVILSTEGTIRAEHLPESVRRGGTTGSSPAPAGQSTRPFREAKRDVVEAFEHSYLRDLMQRHAGNVTAASQQAGMLRSALQRLLRKYTLKSSEFRKPRRVRPVEEATRSVGD